MIPILLILIKDDRLYTMYRNAKTGEEVVVALAAGTGEPIWEHRYSVEIWDDMSRAFGLGPNATPLIVDDRIISVSIDGEVRCLDLATGKLQWRHDLPAEDGRRPTRASGQRQR
jgi:outer membrane protein assembly factor BamB